LASLARPLHAVLPEPEPPRGRQRLYRWLDLPRFFTLAVLLTMLIAAVQPVTDPDFWWHVTTGNWILSHHAVPHHDLFTYTVPTHRWITHEWLSEAIVAALFAIGHLPLVSLVLGGVTAAGFLLVYMAIDRRVNFVIAALSLTLGVAAANPIWGPRIQMVTFALAALTYLWIKRYCEGRGRAIYALPIVMLFWVNLHAGFFIAYAFLSIALAAEGLRWLMKRPDAMPGRRLRNLVLVLAASVAAAIVNPNGWDIYLYPFQTLSSGAQQRLIVEWFSPNFQMSQMIAFEAMIFLLIGGLAVSRRDRIATVPLSDGGSRPRAAFRPQSVFFHAGGCSCPCRLWPAGSRAPELAVARKAPAGQRRQLRHSQPAAGRAVRDRPCGERPQPYAAGRRQAGRAGLSDQGGRLPAATPRSRPHAERVWLGRLPHLPTARCPAAAASLHLRRCRRDG